MQRRSPLFLYVLLLAVICGASSLIFRGGAQALRQKGASLLEYQLSNTRETIEASMRALLEDLERIVAHSAMLRILDNDVDNEIAELLSTTIDHIRGLSNLSCYSATGAVIASTERFDPAHLEPLKEDHARRFLSGTRAEIEQQGSELFITVPVLCTFDQPELIGVLRAHYSVEALLPNGSVCWTGVVSGAGPSTLLAARSPFEGEAPPTNAAALEGADEGDWVTRRAVLSCPKDVHGPELGVVIAQRSAELFGQIDVLRSMVLWLTTGTSFLILAMLFVFFRSQRVMVEQLARRAVELEQLNLGLQRSEQALREQAEQVEAANEQYRSLVETTGTIPWRMDVEARQFTYVGPQASRFLDCSVADWLRPGFWDERVHPDDQAAAAEYLDRAINQKADVTFDFRMKRDDGLWVWARSIVSAGSDSNDTQLTGIMLDITQQRLLELELQQAQKLESVGRLAAGIAHEINTPIQFVGDSVHFVRDAFSEVFALLEKYTELRETARRGESIAEVIAAMERAEEEADIPYLAENLPKALDRSIDGLGRVATIVGSMKEFAHPNQKDKASADINKAVATTLTIARSEYKYVAEVRTDFGDLPQVLCHLGELNQAVLNIVVNAAHAIGDVVKGTENKGCISVQTRREGDHVLIAISDTGGGIPETIRGRIFDPFFTTKAVGKGTGQGLAIARSVVVDKHAGEMTFESEVGKGTTFFIRIPIDGGGAKLARGAA